MSPDVKPKKSVMFGGEEQQPAEQAEAPEAEESKTAPSKVPTVRGGGGDQASVGATTEMGKTAAAADLAAMQQEEQPIQVDQGEPEQ